MEFSNLESAVRQEPSKGIRRWIMVSGDKTMMVLIELDEGSVIPMHNHHNEQTGYVLKGRVEFRTPSGTYTFSEGTAYLLRSNEPHEVRNPGPGKAVVLEVFSPPREDFLKK